MVNQGSAPGGRDSSASHPEAHSRGTPATPFGPPSRRSAARRRYEHLPPRDGLKRGHARVDDVFVYDLWLRIVMVPLGVVGFISLIRFWRAWQRRAVEEDPPFGSRGWHWPALALLAVLLVILGLIRAFDPA